MINIFFYVAACSLFLLPLSVVFPGSTAADESSGLSEILVKRGVISPEEYKVLKARKRASGMKSATIKSHGGLFFASPDGSYQFQFLGRFFIDSAFYSSDSGSPPSNGTQVRVARLGVKGLLAGEWSYKASVAFTEQQKVNYKDFAGSWHGKTSSGVPIVFTIGHFKQPFSLGDRISTRFLTFMEKSTPVNAFAPGRKMGLGLSSHGRNWTADTGIFGEGFKSNQDQGNEGWGVRFRLTYAPLNSKNHAVHLGVSSYYRTPESSTVRVRAYPEGRLNLGRLVDTGEISDVSGTLAYAIETAWMYRGLSVQGEYLKAQVRRLKNMSHPGFDGYYVYISWFPFDGSRNYSGSQGKFVRNKVKKSFKPSDGTWGNLELALRFSNIDLDKADIAGGKEENVTYGVNWYLTSQIRMMANYTNTNLYDSSGGPDIFQLRFQMDFY